MSLDSATTTTGHTTARTGALQAGLGLSGLTLDELHNACTRLGYPAGHAELESALTGHHDLDDHQYDIVTRAINDRLVDNGLTAMIPDSDEI